MKVLLIEPPRWKGWPMLRADRCSRPAVNCKGNAAPFPYWLSSTAAYLRENGIEIDILDANALDLSWMQVEQHISKSNPNSIIFTGANCSIDWDLNTATIAKRINPNIKTAIFEPLLSPQKPENIFALCPALDAIFLSEPENIALSFCKKGLRAIGIAYLKKGKVVRNKTGPIDITNIPMPAYDLLPMERYDEILLRASRGCPFSCNFCTLGSATNTKSVFFYEKKLRFRLIQNIIAELQYLQNRGYSDKLVFGDETFTINKTKTIEFCNLIIKNSMDVRFRIQTRVDCIDEDMLAALKNAGCYHIGYGVESGDDDLLKTLNKGINANQIKRAFDLTRKAGIKTTAFNIIGHIGETKNTIEKTVRLNEDILPDSVQFAIATPMIGTVLWNYCKTNNLFIVDEKTIERAVVGAKIHIRNPAMSVNELHDILRQGLWRMNLAYLRIPPAGISNKIKFYAKRLKTAYKILRLSGAEFPGKIVVNRF